MHACTTNDLPESHTMKKTDGSINLSLLTTIPLRSIWTYFTYNQEITHTIKKPCSWMGICNLHIRRTKSDEKARTRMHLPSMTDKKKKKNEERESKMHSTDKSLKSGA